MRKLNGLILSFFLFLSFFSSFITVTPNNEGETVFINDENIFLSCDKVSSGGYIYINFTSKKYSGLIDFALGFNSYLHKPSKMQIYNPKYESVLNSFNYPDFIFNNETYWLINITWDERTPKYFINGTVFVYWKNLNTTEWERYSFKNFRYVDRNNYTLYYDRVVYSEWKDISIHRDKWNKINYLYSGVDSWFYTTFNVTQNKNYYARIWLEVKPNNKGNIFKKYCIGIKPHNEGFKEAINKNHFYVLDPLVFDAWFKRINHTITGSDAFQFSDTDYQVNFTLHYGFGVNNGENMYFNETCQSDFDDIRFVDNDGNVLYYWIEDNKWIEDGYNKSIVWVKIEQSLDVDRDIIIYWDNPLASSYSDITNTWILFDEFSGSTLSNKFSYYITDSTYADYTQGGGSLIMSRKQDPNLQYKYASAYTNNNYYWEHRMIFRVKYDIIDTYGGITYSRNGFQECYYPICDNYAVQRHNCYQNSHYDETAFYWQTIDGGNPSSSKTTGFDTTSNNTWYTERIYWDSTSVEFWYVNGSVNNFVRREEWDVPINQLYAEFKSQIYYGGGSDNKMKIYYDWIVIGKYVYPEPNHDVYFGYQELSWICECPEAFNWLTLAVISFIIAIFMFIFYMVDSKR